MPTARQKKKKTHTHTHTHTRTHTHFDIALKNHHKLLTFSYAVTTSTSTLSMWGKTLLLVAKKVMVKKSTSVMGYPRTVIYRSSYILPKTKGICIYWSNSIQLVTNRTSVT